MKKHPVDDLFKSKLSDWDKKPTSSAWEKIQKESKNERKGMIWPWYAAASIIITLLAGYAVWKYSDNAVMPTNNTKALALTDKKISADPVMEINQEDSSAYQLAVPEKRPEIKANRKKLKRSQQKVLVTPEQLEPGESIVAIKETEPVNSRTDVAHEEIVVNDKPEIKPLSVETVATRIKSVENEPSRTIVIAVETQSNEEVKSKSSKLSRVFRQLKNARAGEHVDWEEVGFNPKSLVAKVDDRLRNGEEKVSEKYHNLKEKTKL